MIPRLWVLCLIALAGCESSVESQRERELWDDLGIRSYQYEYMVSCFCGQLGPNPALITVTDGVVTRVEPVDGDPSFTGALTEYPTIDGLFEIISRARAGDPSVLTIEYDQTYHYPRLIFLDPAERAIDDEITHRVERFIPSPVSQ